MRRRQFLSLIGASCISPLAAHAQQPERIRRIGVVLALSEQDAEIQTRIAAFRKELERLVGGRVATSRLNIAGRLLIPT